jgi:hypothetical protein
MHSCYEKSALKKFVSVWVTYRLYHVGFIFILEEGGICDGNRLH